jgi:phage terminase large subunit-like protein
MADAGEELYAQALAEYELEQRKADAELARWIPRQARELGHRAYEGLAPLYEVWDRIRAGEQVSALIAAPPRARKTTSCFHGACREMMLRPTVGAGKRAPGPFKYGYATYNVEAARERSRDCHGLAVASGLRVGAVKTIERKGFESASLNLWSATNGSSAKFMGMKGGVTIGAGVDLLHIDDPFKVGEADSAVVLEERWRSISVMLTRLEPHASLIISHHRWVPDDPIGRFLEQIEAGFADLDDDVRAMLEGREWVVIELPAYDGPDKSGAPVVEAEQWRDIDMRTATPLLPDWFSMQELAAVRSLPATGDELFGAMYMQAPSPSGGVLFPTAWPVWEQERGATITVADLEIPVPSLAGKFLIIGCDTAGSEAATADFTAVVLIACWWRTDDFDNPVLHADLLHVWYDRIETTGVVDYIARIARSVPSAQVGFESQGEGRAQLRFLKRDHPDLDVHEITTSTSKRARATPVGNASKSTRVRVPVKASWLGEFRRQTKKFTGRSGPVQDDIPDALAHAWNLASQTSAPLPPLAGAQRGLRGAGTGGF